MPDTRLFIDEVYVDNVDDEVVLVKKIDSLLELIKRNKERLVVVICDEERCLVKNQKGGKE